MKQEGLAYFTDIHYSIIGLIIFIVFFVGVVLWAYRGTAKEHYKKMANLPLKEGDQQ